MKTFVQLKIQHYNVVLCPTITGLVPFIVLCDIRGVRAFQIGELQHFSVLDYLFFFFN